MKTCDITCEIKKSENVVTCKIIYSSARFGKKVIFQLLDNISICNCVIINKWIHVSSSGVDDTLP